MLYRWTGPSADRTYAFATTSQHCRSEFLCECHRKPWGHLKRLLFGAQHPPVPYSSGLSPVLNGRRLAAIHILKKCPTAATSRALLAAVAAGAPSCPRLPSKGCAVCDYSAP